VLLPDAVLTFIMAKNVAIGSRDDDEATSRLETSSLFFRLNLSSSSTAARVESSQAEEEQMDACIWSMLPVELVDKILLWLPIPNLFQMRAVCRSWDRRIRSKSFTLTYMKTPSRGPAAWLFMCSSFNCREHTCAYNPLQNKWHNFPLSFLPPCIRFPLTSVGELLFVRGGLNNAGMLAVCNPMTQAWRELPSMIHTRLNSLVGVCCEDTYASSYKIVVAGGMSECGGDYECTTEVYDSLTDSWQVSVIVPKTSHGCCSSSLFVSALCDGLRGGKRVRVYKKECAEKRKGKKANCLRVYLFFLLRCIPEGLMCSSLDA
jgi:hypothetical protein